MKTMQKMKKEMLKKARFDGGYPRPVVLPFGVLALANNEQEFNRLMRESNIGHALLCVGLVVAVGIPLCLMFWEILF